MRIDVFRDAAAFEVLSPEWNPLLTSSATNVVFLTSEWQSSWWRHMQPGELLIVTFRDDAGKLTAIAPLFLQRAQDGAAVISIVGCRDISDYLDVIADPELEDVIGSELISYLLSQDAPSWDRLELCNVPAAGTANRSLFDRAQRAGLAVDRRLVENCPVISLPSSWNDYLASIDKKQRHEIRRKLRRAESEVNTKWYVIDGSSQDVAENMEAFFRLHRLSSAAKSDFMDERMRSFFKEMGRRIASQGWLHLSFLEMNGQKAAGMLSFEYNNRLEVYNSGYDPETYGSLSPGIVLLSYCIRQAIERGHTEFDFLRGEEEYKYRFGARPNPIYELVIARTRSSLPT